MRRRPPPPAASSTPRMVLVWMQVPPRGLAPIGPRWGYTQPLVCSPLCSMVIAIGKLLRFPAPLGEANLSLLCLRFADLLRSNEINSPVDFLASLR